jgi:hypothetical protein
MQLDQSINLGAYPFELIHWCGAEVLAIWSRHVGALCLPQGERGLQARMHLTT